MNEKLAADEEAGDWVEKPGCLACVKDVLALITPDRVGVPAQSTPATSAAA
jgi:hypothetical protein